MGQSVLSRLSYIGIAKEVTPNTYLAPAAFLPLNSDLKFEDDFGDLTDESYRNNDSVVQGTYQGVGDGAGAFTMNAYPDLLGHLLCAMIGNDTTTAAAVGTTTSGSTAIGATTMTVTSATGIAAGMALMVDTGANVEYVQVANSYVSGTSIPLAKATTILHAGGAAVVSQTTHTFTQANTRRPTYSLTEYTPVTTRGWAGAVLEELGFKIDPKGIVTVSTKWQSLISAIQSNPTPTWTKAQPLLGWQWVSSQGGVTSDRGITLDVTAKREVEPIHASTGTQAAEEVFNGAITYDGTYKSRFSDETDLLNYIGAIRQPFSALLTQPVTPTQMGASLNLLTSSAALYKGAKNLGNKYADADFSLRGNQNTVDGGTLQAVLKNFTTTTY